MSWSTIPVDGKRKRYYYQCPKSLYVCLISLPEPITINNQTSKPIFTIYIAYNCIIQYGIETMLFKIIFLKQKKVKTILNLMHKNHLLCKTNASWEEDSFSSLVKKLFGEQNSTMQGLT